MYTGTRKIINILLSIMILLNNLAGCKNLNINSSSVNSSPPINDSNSMSNEIYWLIFSSEEYEIERQAIRSWYKQKYESIRETQGENAANSPIYITKFDMDNDGQDELIAGLIGIYWGGVAGGAVHVFRYENNEVISSARVANFRLDYSILDQENNEQVGVLRGTRGNYDFVVLGEIWFWEDIWYEK